MGGRYDETHPPNVNPPDDNEESDDSGPGIEILPGLRYLAHFTIPRHPPPGWRPQQLQQQENPQDQNGAQYQDQTQDIDNDIDIEMKGWSSTDSDCEWDGQQFAKRRRVESAAVDSIATSSNEQPVLKPRSKAQAMPKTKPKLQNKKLRNKAQSSKDADEKQRTENEQTMTPLALVEEYHGRRLSGQTLEEQIEELYGRSRAILTEQFFDYDYSSMR